jgi:hypothetical protein
MSDAVVHMSENSPEHVAHKLMHEVATVEKKVLHGSTPSSGWTTANRAWILDTYAECLRATRGLRKPDSAK